MATTSHSFVDIRHDKTSTIPAGTATIHISEDRTLPATVVITKFPEQNAIDINRDAARDLLEATSKGNSYFNVIGDDIFEIRPKENCAQVCFDSDWGSPSITISGKDFNKILETLREWISN